MKAIALNEAQSRLNQFLKMPRTDCSSLLAPEAEVANLERAVPTEFGGDFATLEKMLVKAVQGPHLEWTPQDLADITLRVREKRHQ